MPQRRHIFVCNHLCKPFSICLQSQAGIFRCYQPQQCIQMITFSSKCILKEVILGCSKYVQTQLFQNSTFYSLFRFFLKLIPFSSQSKCLGTAWKIDGTASSVNIRPIFPGFFTKQEGSKWSLQILE